MFIALRLKLTTLYFSLSVRLSPFLSTVTIKPLCRLSDTVHLRTQHYSTTDTCQQFVTEYAYCVSIYRGADKSLARPGRKQANVSVRMA